ncbi:hypothetical protein Esti_002266 [Eimeria stiedai]
MAAECESTRLVRILYPNVSAFAAGDPPQRGGSRAAFEAASFDRKTVVLPPPYTFSLNRIPSTRVSNTNRETFDFAQVPLHAEGEAADATSHALYARGPRDPSALFKSVDFVPQLQSVLHKEYPLEPHKPGSMRLRKTCSPSRVSSRPPAPQPPYRTDSLMRESSDAKEVHRKSLSQEHEDDEAAYRESPVVKPHRRVQMAEAAWDSATNGCCSHLRGSAPCFGKSCFGASPSLYQRTPEQETAGRRSSTRCVSFVCRAHRGRHVHLLDLSAPQKPSRQRRSSTLSRPVAADDGAGKGVHKPNCCSAFMMLRRCGCNEAELPARADFVAQPQITREPRFEEPVEDRIPSGDCEAWMFQRGDREGEKEADETPQSKARRLGLNFKYYYRNYSDPKLLHSG